MTDRCRLHRLAGINSTVDDYVIVWPKTVMLSDLPDAAETRQSDEPPADRQATVDTRRCN